MKNLIRKRHSLSRTNCHKSDCNEDKSSFLYNTQSVSVIVEVLIGAILGVALCFGFFFAFFILRGSLIVSLGIFFIILICALFAVLILKYMLVLVTLKIKEMALLKAIASRKGF